MASLWKHKYIDDFQETVGFAVSNNGGLGQDTRERIKLMVELSRSPTLGTCRSRVCGSTAKPAVSYYFLSCSLPETEGFQLDQYVNLNVTVGYKINIIIRNVYL